MNYTVTTHKVWLTHTRQYKWVYIHIHTVHIRKYVHTYVCTFQIKKENDELKINKNLWNGTIYYLS